MNLINFLKNKDHQLAILLLSVMIFVFLFLEQCSTNKGERLKYEQNLYALTDSVKVLKNKEGEYFSSRAITIGRIKDLEKLNSDLAAEAKKLKGDLVYISKIKPSVVYVDRPVETLVYVNPDGQYSLKWSDSVVYDGYYRKIKAHTNLRIDPTTAKIIEPTVKTTIDLDSLHFVLTTGIWKNNETDKYEIFVRNSNPNMKFNLSGNVVEDEIAELAKLADKPSKLGIGLYGGVGFDTDLKIKLQLGIGVQFSLIRF